MVLIKLLVSLLNHLYPDKSEYKYSAVSGNGWNLLIQRILNHKLRMIFEMVGH